MLKDFIDFVDSVLPSVPMGTKEGVQAAIAQFEKSGEQVKYLTIAPLSVLSQGDVISAVPFYYFDENGRQQAFKADALILSTSCHIDQKDKVVLVPVLPLDVFEGNVVELKKNKVIDFMYIPDGNMVNRFVDFELMNTFSKDLIMNGLESGRIKRVASLNQLGYYFFVIKLTVYLLRKEDIDTQQERNIGFAY